MIYKVNDVTLRLSLLSEKGFIDIKKKKEKKECIIVKQARFSIHLENKVIMDLVNIERSIKIMW